jgi:hypothetical protein
MMFIVLDFIPRVQKFKELLTFRSFKTSTWVEKDDQNLKDQKIIKNAHEILRITCPNK